MASGSRSITGINEYQKCNWRIANLWSLFCLWTLCLKLRQIFKLISCFMTCKNVWQQHGLCRFPLGLYFFLFAIFLFIVASSAILRKASWHVFHKVACSEPARTQPAFLATRPASFRGHHQTMQSGHWRSGFLVPTPSVREALEQSTHTKWYQREIRMCRSNTFVWRVCCQSHPEFLQSSVDVCLGLQDLLDQNVCASDVWKWGNPNAGWGAALEALLVRILPMQSSTQLKSSQDWGRRNKPSLAPGAPIDWASRSNSLFAQCFLGKKRPFCEAPGL